MAHKPAPAKPSAKDPEFISIPEAGLMVGYSDKTIRRKIAAGQLRAYTMGDTRSYRVRRADVLALMTPCPAPYLGDEATDLAFG